MSALLPHSEPEAEGVSSEALRLLLAGLAARLDSVHAVVVVRHGRIVAEAGWAPFTPATPHAMYSISKSFTSSAVGLAVEEGLLRVDERLVDVFPESVPADPDPRLGAMRIEHLLTMTTGHAVDTKDAILATADPVAAFLAQPLAADPGALFVYNTGASYLLSAIVQRRSGQPLLDYLTPRLLEPLGIADAAWERDERGVDMGGFGLSIDTLDLAVFGELLLRRGELAGRRVLPAEWIDTATSRRVPNAGENPNPDWRQGYGYQFWRSRHGYRGDGAFGQFCVVLPEDDAVVAISSSIPDMQLVLQLLWDLRAELFSPGPLSEDRAARDELAATIAGLGVPAPDGGRLPEELAGARFALEDAPYDTLALEPDPAGTALVLARGAEVLRVSVGVDEWVPVTTERGAGFARGGWRGTEFRARIVAANGPLGDEHELSILGDRVVWTSRELASFGPIVPVHVLGSRQAG